MLEHALLTDSFSTGKDELVLQFAAKNQTVQLNIRFAGGEMFFRHNDIQKFPGRTSQIQFKNVIQQHVVSIDVLRNDRGFKITFSNDNVLLFKGFGKFGNVMLFEGLNEPPTSIFRTHLKKDLAFRYSENPAIMATHPLSISEAQSAFPFLAEEHLAFLNAMNYDDLAEDEQKKVWTEMLNQSYKGEFFQGLKNDLPYLYCLPMANCEALSTGIEGLDAYVKNYLSAYFFKIEKQKLHLEVTQKLKHFSHLLRENEKKLNLLQSKRSYKELGDIVMSYAHSIKPGVSEAFLPDFYTGNPIRIKLNPNISASENASLFYRKAKNEHLEVEKVQGNIEASKKELVTLESRKIQLESASHFKDLKTTSAGATNNQVENKPYKILEFEGFHIWIGKNAKSNDALIKLAQKNDLWLHAKDYQGSHVIIKKAGNVFPNSVIQFAANVAAKNSKGKTQSVVPVLAVERKFVVKPKNAKPGEVKVLKEIVVDGFPDEG